MFPAFEQMPTIQERKKRKQEVIHIINQCDCQLTHEEVKNGHVHNVQQSCPSVIRWSLFDFLTVVWVHLPPEEFKIS